MDLRRIYREICTVDGRHSQTPITSFEPERLSLSIQLMHHTPPPTVFHSFASNAELVEALTAFILNVQGEALDKKGHFSIALSGGSLPKQLAGLIGNPGIKWDRW